MAVYRKRHSERKSRVLLLETPNGAFISLGALGASFLEGVGRRAGWYL